MHRMVFGVMLATAGCGRLGFDSIGDNDLPPGTCDESAVDAIGSGTADDPFLLCNARQLVALMDPAAAPQWSAHFRLGADLDLAGLDESTAPATHPIGTRATPFTGTFDGAGHAISNLTHRSRRSEHVGLFGVVSGDGAALANLRMIDVSLHGEVMVGGLAGLIEDGAAVTNCHSSGSVRAEVEYAGGLIGAVGGVWVSNGRASVARSSSAANAIAAGSNWAGGLVGNVAGNSTCTDSFATGDATATLDFAGGLAGGSTGVIRNSYATGDVIGKSSVGGLVGSSGGEVTNAFTISTVLGARGLTGALIGDHWAGEVEGSATLAACAVEGSNCHGALVGERTELELAQLVDPAQRPLAAWDLAAIWSIDAGGLPALR
jgi:hypothetical protein